MNKSLKRARRLEHKTANQQFCASRNRTPLLYSIALALGMLIFSAAPAAAGVAAVSGSDAAADNFALMSTMGLIGVAASVRELTAKRAKCVADAKAIQQKAESEKRSLTDDETSAFDKLLDEAEDIETVQIPAARASEEEQQKRASRLQTMLGTGSAPATPPPRGADPSGSQDRNDDPVENPDPNKYSILRAVRCIANKKSVDGYEGEISQEIAKRTGRDPQGFFMPHNLRLRSLSGRNRRAISTVSDVSGMAPNDYQGGLFIEELRNKTLAIQSGATLLSGLEGDVDIPKQTGHTTAYFVGENGAPTGSKVTVGQISVSPTTQGAVSDIGRRALKQTSRDMDQFTMNDMFKAMRIGLDSAIIAGTGLSNNPLGILEDPDIPTIAIGTDGGALTRAHILQLEEEVSTANADDGTLTMMTNAKVRKVLKETPIDAGSGKFLWKEDNTIEGYQTAVTGQMPSGLTKGTGTNLSSLIYGDWSMIVVCFWSGIDVMVDPYTFSDSGAVRLVMLQDLQIAKRYPQGMRKIVDIDTSGA